MGRGHGPAGRETEADSSTKSQFELRWLRPACTAAMLQTTTEPSFDAQRRAYENRAERRRWIKMGYV